MVNASKFTLPKDWSVVEVPRKLGGAIDKYYNDPETGRRFRSLKEVERYVTQGVTPASTRTKRLNYDHHHEKNSGSPNRIISSGKSSGSPNRIISSGKNSGSPNRITSRGENPGSPNRTMLRGKNSGSPDMIASSGEMSDCVEDKDGQYQLANVSSTSISPTPPFKLPDGWVVEEVPRRLGDYIDKYYYEPGTGQRFRSMLAVQKHLTELEENAPLSAVLEKLRENSLPISKAFKLSSRIKNYGSYNSWKKSTSRKEEASLFVSPPSKINWVISDSGGDSWNAFLDDKLVPDSTKQQWDKTLMLTINNKHDELVSG